MALLTTDIDPFGDGSLIRSFELDNDTVDNLGDSTITSGSSMVYKPMELNNGIDVDSNSYVQMDYVSELQNSHSVFCWIIANSTADTPIASAHNIANGATNTNLIAVKSGKAYFYGYNGAQKTLSGNIGISTGVLTHIGYTLDESGIVTLYVNGVEDTNASVGLNFQATEVYSFGRAQRHLASSVEYFDGDIDQFMVFNRGLTSGEVAEVFNMEVPAPSGGLAVTFNGVVTTQVFFNGVELTEAHMNGTQLQ